MEKKILIVEDDYSIREAMKELLEIEGYTVLLAENGEKGLAMARERSDELGLIFLDLMMPVLGGQEVLKAMCSDSATGKPRTPVVLFSAAKPEPEMSMAEFIKKPVEADNILRIAQKYCGPSTTSASY